MKRCTPARVGKDEERDLLIRKSMNISKDKTLNRWSGGLVTLFGLTGAPQRDNLLNSMKDSSGSSGKKNFPRLTPIPEDGKVSSSAPAKVGDVGPDSVQPSPSVSPEKNELKLPVDEHAGHKQDEHLEMETHETLLFHFLSILALIPSRRGEFDEYVKKFDELLLAREDGAEDQPVRQAATEMKGHAD